MSTIDLDYSIGSCSIPNVTDLDGDKYDRIYKGLNVSQTLKLTELTIPVYADVEFNLASGLSLYGDLGLRFNFNMSSSIDLGSVKVGEISGYYGDYGITLGGEWTNADNKSYEGFTNKQIDLKSEIDDTSEGVSGMTFDVISGAGLRYNIPNTPLAIDLGLKFQLGLSEMLKHEGTSKFSIKYDRKDEFSGVERISSLTDMLTSVKRNALALNIGLIFKF